MRPVHPDGAAGPAAPVAANRDVLAPWEPVRPADFATVPGQAVAVEGDLARARAGLALPCAGCYLHIAGRRQDHVLFHRVDEG